VRKRRKKQEVKKSGGKKLIENKSQRICIFICRTASDFRLFATSQYLFMCAENLNHLKADEAEEN